MLNRSQLSQVYRPVGPKSISSGLAWSDGGSAAFTQSIDLSLPIRGLRLAFKGRISVGTADFTSVNPEGILNLIPNIKIIGTNKRQGGNVTLYDIDLATLFVIQHLMSPNRAAHFEINGAIVAVPSQPFPSYFSGSSTTANFDFRVVVDLPFHTFDCPEGARPGYLMRQEEWRDSVQIFLSYGHQLTNSAGALGVAAATTTVAFHAFGSSSGSPTIDLYSLPILMGRDLAPLVTPGFITRVQQPVNTVLQSAGSGINLLTLQKQPTGRIYIKNGVGSTVSGFTYFSSLLDTNITAIGLTLGGNRAVRNLVDVFAHKTTEEQQYDHDPIQGYMVFDFLQSRNPDSAYPGDQVGEGATFQLVANVAGVSNAYGLIVQEQNLYRPEGPLYSF